MMGAGKKIQQMMLKLNLKNVKHIYIKIKIWPRFRIMNKLIHVSSKKIRLRFYHWQIVSLQIMYKGEY